ncbi:MAG TPA: hypothetical protein VLW44_06120 [Streptosporangiaceae bacterium]|nr:hypothetical protein [Streptosporangiaceae bacterium]
MIPVTVSGTSIIVLRTATSHWGPRTGHPAQVRNNVLAGIVSRSGEIVTCWRPGAGPGARETVPGGPLTGRASGAAGR